MPATQPPRVVTRRATNKRNVIARGIEVVRADGLSLSFAIETFIERYVAAAKKHGSGDLLAKLLRK
jgi:hypothetical protein